MHGRDSTCANNGMTGARVCVRSCDTIHGHECALAVEQGWAGTRRYAGGVVGEVWEREREIDRSGRRYSKLAVRATLINKKSLNFPWRAERKSGPIPSPRIDVLCLFPGFRVCTFSKWTRRLNSTCDAWISLVLASELHMDGQMFVIRREGPKDGGQIRGNMKTITADAS